MVTAASAAAQLRNRSRRQSARGVGVVIAATVLRHTFQLLHGMLRVGGGSGGGGGCSSDGDGGAVAGDGDGDGCCGAAASSGGGAACGCIN